MSVGCATRKLAPFFEEKQAMEVLMAVLVIGMTVVGFVARLAGA